MIIHVSEIIPLVKHHVDIVTRISLVETSGMELYPCMSHLHIGVNLNPGLAATESVKCFRRCEDGWDNSGASFKAVVIQLLGER